MAGCAESVLPRREGSAAKPTITITDFKTDSGLLGLRGITRGVFETVKAKEQVHFFELGSGQKVVAISAFPEDQATYGEIFDSMMKSFSKSGEECQTWDVQTPERLRNRQLSRSRLCERLSDEKSLTQFVRNVSEAFANLRPTKIAAIETMGFILGAAVAQPLRCGLVLISKTGFQNESDYHAQTLVDYSGTHKTLYLLKSTINRGDSIIVIDDYIDTGAQVRAACHLLRKAGAEVIAVACVGQSTGADLSALPKIFQFSFRSYVGSSVV